MLESFCLFHKSINQSCVFLAQDFCSDKDLFSLSSLKVHLWQSARCIAHQDKELLAHESRSRRYSLTPEFDPFLTQS
jgi:hypothetical protein